MGWRDTVTGQGKFRGVPFFFDKVDGEIGRRSVLKEFPGRDKPLVEDNGRATRRFTIEMFVLGENYDADRDALREALETPGPGELEHPYWGTLNVTLDGKAHVTESTKQGGIAKFTASFIEAGDRLREIFAPDTAQTVLSDADRLIADASSAFAAIFSVTNAIASVAEEAIELINSVASAANTIRGKIASALLVIDSAAAAVTAVTDTVSALILTPVTLASTMHNMIDTVVQGITNIGDAFDAAAEFFGSEEALPAEGNIIAQRVRVSTLESSAADLGDMTDGFPALSDATAQQEEIKRNNQIALKILTKASAIASASSTAIELTYESYDQAQSMREALTDLIDDLLLEETLRDDVYLSLVNLRSSLTDHFASVSSSLPELQEFTANSTIPALALAYRLYGDSKKEADILARNPVIRDPSAVPGGTVIQVLIDA